MIEIISMSPEEYRLGYERYLMELPREPINKTKDVLNQHYDDYIKKLIKEGKARVIHINL